MVQEDFNTGLEILDYLELFNSTVEAARFLGISQSGCSRRYRGMSESLCLGFDRIVDRYQATANLDVLASLRQAAQKLRVRHRMPRLSLGWQLGTLPMQELEAGCSLLPIRPMDAWQLLSLLEQRLIDVAITGLLEFMPLLEPPPARLRARPLPLSNDLWCVPLVMFPFMVFCHSQHPLQERIDLSSEQLSVFPSPAVSIGMAPNLMRSLQSHGLARQPSGLANYEEMAWEGRACDGTSLSYGGSFLLPNLERRLRLEALNYNLDLHDCLGLVGHRDVITDPAFLRTLRLCRKSLQTALAPSRSALDWLS